VIKFISGFVVGVIIGWFGFLAWAFWAAANVNGY